jgi:hypothetical protein
VEMGGGLLDILRGAKDLTSVSKALRKERRRT